MMRRRRTPTLPGNAGASPALPFVLSECEGN